MDSLDNLLFEIEKSQDKQERAGLAEKFLTSSLGSSFSEDFVFGVTKNYNRKLQSAIKDILAVVSAGDVFILQDINRLRKAYECSEIKNVVLETYKTCLLCFESYYCPSVEKFSEESAFVDYMIQIKENLVNYKFARKLLRNIQKQIILRTKGVLKGNLWEKLMPIETILAYKEKNSLLFYEKINEIFMKDENPAIRLNKIAELISQGSCKSADEICEVASLDLPEGYKPIRKLGKGGSGSVYLVENTADKSKEALKILNLQGNTEDVLRAIESELQVKKLNRLRCPYIPTYYVFPYKGKFIISMEPYEKTLQERLEEAGGRLPLYEATKYYEQLCEALDLCHKNEIVHKDLAPHNIGIDAEGNIKLSDFGDPLTTMDKKSKQPPLDYSSPRLLASSEGKLEVLPNDNGWALGVMLYEMLTGEKPFSSKEIEHSDRKRRKEYIQNSQNEASKDDFKNLLSRIEISEDEAEQWFEQNERKIGNLFSTYKFFLGEKNREDHADLPLWIISKQSKAEMIKKALSHEFLCFFSEGPVHDENGSTVYMGSRIQERRFLVKIVANLNKYWLEHTGIPQEYNKGDDANG